VPLVQILGCCDRFSNVLRRLTQRSAVRTHACQRDGHAGERAVAAVCPKTPNQLRFTGRMAIPILSDNPPIFRLYTTVVSYQ
jgi:hypothetical protein